MGHRVLAVRNGFAGLVENQIDALDWFSVNGWVGQGGAELGTNRVVPQDDELAAVARTLEKHAIQGVLMIGGRSGYEAAYRLHRHRAAFPAFNIPIICVPATIDNDLPGSELSIGADTALNSIVEAVDKIKQSAVAYRRCYVVEVMGRHCGYLALMSGMATGAERVYLPEEGVTLADLVQDVHQLMRGFEQNKRLALLIRNELANPVYTTAFMAALFEEAGGARFDVRQAILGHLQQGGSPTPFDRIAATRLAAAGIERLIEAAAQPAPTGAFVGIQDGEIQFHALAELPEITAEPRQTDPWWIALRAIANVMSEPDPTRSVAPDHP
jgi:6-phosphofructokinase 1